MTVAINLTPVLITLIICVTLCVICKMGKQDKKRNNMQVVTKEEHSKIHGVTSIQEKRGEGKQ